MTAVERKTLARLISDVCAQPNSDEVWNAVESTAPLACPPKTRAMLDIVYRREGIGIWLTSKNQLLDHRRPIDLLADGDDERVYALLLALAEGAIL